MPIASFAEWKDFLRHHPEAHLLQTGEWGELKAAFGWQPVRILSGDLGAQVLFHRLPFGLTWAYMPKAPPAVLHSTGWWREADAHCRQRRAVFLKVEPDLWEGAEFDGAPNQEFSWNEKDSPGLIVSPHSIQPPRTIIVSLQGSEDDILARMRQKCRYNVRLAEKKNFPL